MTIVFTGTGLDWAVITIILGSVIVAIVIRLIIRAINDHTRGLQ